VNRLLLPVIAVQGMRLRSTIITTPPATGPTSGTVGSASGPPLRLAVLGDSTAAGCGVDTHDNGFTGWLARELAGRARRTVSWQVVGQFGATARRIRHRLLPQLGADLDVAVLLAGGNDVLARRTPAEWREDLAAILDGLTDRAEQVVVAGIPPFASFPSLPGTLGRYLGEHASALDAVSRQLCAEHPRTTWVTPTGVPPPDYFAHDRFHPSASGYRFWAQVVADRLGRLTI
jgi:lysophospholipase L1-like esterase